MLVKNISSSECPVPNAESLNLPEYRIALGRSGRVANATRLSIYVLESSNSRRLTYFMPPLVS